MMRWIYSMLMLCGLVWSAAAAPLSGLWKEFARAGDGKLPRSATNVLATIEKTAAAEKAWPDLAAAIMLRAKLEYGITEESALKAEGKEDLVAKYAAQVESAPVEVRPMLRLSLARNYLAMSRTLRYWKSRRTKLAEPKEGELPPWSEEKLPGSIGTLFTQIAADAKTLKAEKTGHWNRLLEGGDEYADACMPTLWDFAVNDMAAIVAEAGNFGSGYEKLKSQVVKWYDELVAMHANEPDALACAGFRRLQFTIPDAAKRNEALKALAEKHFELSRVSAEIANAGGDALKSEVDRHAFAKRFAERWPESPGGMRCDAVVRGLEKPELELACERNWTNPADEIEIRYKNLTNVVFRLVKLHWAEVLELGGGSYTKVDFLRGKLADPVREWSVALPRHDDFREHQLKTVVPKDLAKGHYLLFAAPDSRFAARDDRPCYATLISVTDLAVVMERGDLGEGEPIGRVYDATTGEEQKAVTVEFWKSGCNGFELFSTAVTAADGSFAACTNGYWDGMLRVRQGSDEMFVGDVSISEASSDDEPQLEHLSVITDRSIYRPGQTIRFKGYAFRCDPKTRDYRPLEGREVRVGLRDVNNKEIAHWKLKSSSFGTFSAKFTAPRDALTGRFTVQLTMTDGDRPSRKVTGSSAIRVEEYRRPKFRVEFDPVKDEKLGSETKLTGCALTFTGLPVAEAEVEWKVNRRTSWAWWYFGRRDSDESVFAQGRTRTDADGKFTIAFTPTPKPGVGTGGDPAFSFDYSANVTDGTGESHPASGSFTVGEVPWRAGVSVDNGRAFLPKKASVKVTLNTLMNQPVAAEGRLVVYRLKYPEKVTRKPLESSDWSWRRYANKPEKKVVDSNPETWESGETVTELEVATDGKRGWEGEVELPAGAYRAECRFTAPNGRTVRDERMFRVIDSAAKQYAIPEPFFADLESREVKVGGTARFHYGSGYDTGFVRVTVTKGERTIIDRVETRLNGSIEIPVTEELRGGFVVRLMFVRENRLYRFDGFVSVPWDDHELRINAEHLVSKLTSGARERWTFRVSGVDTNDFRSGVEMLACMYDRSLDEIYAHYPNLGFSSWFEPGHSWRMGSLQSGLNHLTRWTGDWPFEFDWLDIAWRKWRGEALGIYETVASGWRNSHLGGRLGRYRGENARKRCAASAPAVECAANASDSFGDDGAVALCCCVEDAEPESPGGNGAVLKRSAARSATASVVPRKNLKETAFFIPQLKSDGEGCVEFSFEVPEALTGWKFFALAHDRKLASGSLVRGDIVTVKPLMVEPAPPRFAREGDTFRFPVKITNTEDKPQKGEVTLEFAEAETGKYAADWREGFELGPKESKTIEFPVRIPDGSGFLMYVAKAAGRGFSDGEEGYLPILSKRTEVRESLPIQIRKAGTKTVEFTKLLESGKSGTVKNVNLTVQAVSDPSWYAFLALPYLMEFPHECNEQLFSRYYADTLGAKIANANPKSRTMFEKWSKTEAKAVKSPLELNGDLKSIALDATPWVNEAVDETRAKRRIAELFGSARLESEQRRALEKLKSNLASDDLWPWFPGGRGSVWVSLNNLTGFARLERLTGVKQPSWCDRVRNAVDHEMLRVVTERLKGKEFHLSDDELRWLYLQSFDGSWHRLAKLLVSHLKQDWKDFSIAGEALGAIVLWRHGEKELAKAVVKSLKERAVRSEEFGLYWKRNQFFDCSIFAAPVSDQALAMEAFHEVTPEDRAAYEDARLWLLEQKRTQNWSTTVSTVDAVYAILLDMTRGAERRDHETGRCDSEADEIVVKLGGKEVPRKDVEAGTGFYEARFDGPRIGPELGKVEVSRRSDRLGWVSLNWTYLEDVMKVTPYEQSGLRLVKKYFRKTLVDGKTRLVALDGGEALHPGDELVSRLEIASDRVYEYVHLKDERPASAEPVDAISRYRWQDGLGYYQATRDTATHYYFDRLAKGNFVLETSYRVRQQGVFTSGLATMECMYAPEFGAHSAAAVIEVKRN